MNEQLVREVLDEQAEREMPITHDLWPSVRERLGSPKKVGHYQSRMVPLLKPLLAASIIAALLALGTMAWLAQPGPVSAAEILARTEQAANSPGVKSFHGVWSSRSRNEATQPFYESHSERWYLAPDRSRGEGRTSGHNGGEETSLVGQDGKMMWLYLSEYDAVILKDRDNSTPVFGASSLESLTGRGWLKDWYEPKLVGTDEVLGRKAYVLEFTLKPEDQWPPDHFPSPITHMKYWVDQQAYFVLKTQGWDAEGNVLHEAGYTSFQIDAPVDPSLFNFAPPEGAKILDTRAAGAGELNALWEQTAQQVSFNVYRPTVWLYENREGRPYYDTAQGIVTQAFPRAKRRSNTFEVQMPVITQRAASGTSLQGSGATMKVGNTTGLYVMDESTQTLTIIRDGTEITISFPVVQNGADMRGRMIEMAESLQLVKK